MPYRVLAGAMIKADVRHQRRNITGSKHHAYDLDAVDDLTDQPTEGTDQQ